jgi:hypothetical protein
MHCFGKFARRAHISHALRLSASETMIAFRSGCWLRTLCFGSSRRKVHGARSSIPASAFRQGRRGSICIGVHRRLTIRSSRPHVVASAMCFTLRLHTSAAPPRVGLTQALGGKKHLAALSLATAIDRLRPAWLFGLFSGTLLLRSSPLCALTLRMRCVARLRKQRSSIFEFSAADPRLRTQPAEASRGALKLPGFGFRSSRPQFSVAGFRPA